MGVNYYNVVMVGIDFIFWGIFFLFIYNMFKIFFILEVYLFRDDVEDLII